MTKDRLAFINVYKICAATIIACFLHYSVLLMEPLGEQFLGDNSVILFLMSTSSNYLVELFFMISGILFAFVYKQRIEDGDLSFATFMNKRLLKLLPLCIVTTCVMFAMRIVFEKLFGIAFFQGFVTLNNFISSIFLNNSTLCSVRVNPAAWYVSKLMICYVIAYILCKCHKKIGYLTFFLPIGLGLIIQEEGWNFPLLEFHISRAYIAFFWGILLENILKYACKRQIRNFQICIGVVLLLIPYYLRSLVTDRSSVSIFFVFTGLILIGYNSRILNVIGNTRCFQCLGNISFDLYLWNCPTLLVFMYLHMLGVKTNNYGILCLLILSHIVVAFISAKIGDYVRNFGSVRFKSIV